MNLSQIEIFRMVVDKKCITDAADELHLSQSAVSRQIQALEDLLQVQLLHRSHQGVELTQAGEIVYEYSKNLLALVTKLYNDLEALTTNRAKPFVVAASSTPGNYALASSIWAFKERDSSVKITLQISNTETVIQKVLTGTTDVGIIDGHFKREELLARVIGRDKLVLVAHPDYQLVEGKQMLVNQLTYIPLFVREEGSGTRKSLEKWLEESHLSLALFEHVIELNNTEAIKNAVHKQLGISFLPLLAVRRELETGMFKEIKLSGAQPKHSYSIIYSKDRARAPLTRKFLDFVRSPKEIGLSG